MINGKSTYILRCNEEELEKLKQYVFSKTGKQLELNGKSTDECGGFLEITPDLSEYKITHLNGYASHIAYPSCRTYRDNPLGFIEWHQNEYSVLQNLSIIKHIPHSSLAFPDGYKLSWFRSDLEIEKNNLKMCDIGIDRIAKCVKGTELVAPYSRLYCDVERFKNPKIEPMAKLGQGYIYEKDCEGKDLDRINSKEAKREIDKYYNQWHRKFNKAVLDELKKGKNVLILDFHSYSDYQASKISDGNDFPDVCVGYNEKFCDSAILNLIHKRLEQYHLNYKDNYPYTGSILPKCAFDEKYKGRVTSIMLEFNKRLYLY